MKIVMIGNPQGGVGKTSIAVNLAASLNSRGYGVLLIDGDLFCESTRILHRRENKEDVKVATITDFLMDSLPLDEVIQEGVFFDYIAGDKSRGFYFKPTLRLPAEHLLDELKKKEEKYNYVIIDAAVRTPDQNMVFEAAADEIIIPVSAKSHYFVDQIEDYLQYLEGIKGDYNSKLTTTILLNKVDECNGNINLFRKYVNEIEQLENVTIFENSVRDSYLMSDLQWENKFLIEADSHVGIRQDFEHFVDEFLVG
ncbi:Cellulose biosynthesis protein BcsQ [Pseudobutyrivibrio sp. 49]|uniref:ParA family protein n=1 Tax=Pseudobutyrivibrio sp. 49 TaxID=1855344 RepID=UPI00088277F4|nr:ParA family protein [Pseudobutyrivibrio sp. 49]SDI56025.1 Cellulose biosynthesis protein BcsQ [Pseudobutyrivibrio sp. 49]